MSSVQRKAAPLDLNANKSFCVLPWVHLYLDPLGQVFPCCVRNQSAAPFGSLKKQEIEEIWNSEAIREFRRDLMAGKLRPDICEGCYKNEAADGTSHRLRFLNTFGHQLPWALAATQADGSMSAMSSVYIDFRLSNVCNLSCRSCGPAYSSSWAAEYKKNRWSLVEQTLSKKDRQKVFDYYIQQLPNVEEIYFAGGEPLLIPEHDQLLRELIRQKKFDVRLTYATNLSHLKHGNLDVIQLWKNFPNLTVMPSVDHYGARAEYIRKGSHWPTMLQNIKRLRQELPQAKIYPTVTVSVYNVCELTLILNELIKEQFLKHDDPDSFFLNIVRDPHFLHVSTLPAHLRKLATDNIIEYTDPSRADRPGRHKFALVLAELKEAAKESQVEEFLNFTATVDDSRKESFFSLFPEFSILKEDRK